VTPPADSADLPAQQPEPALRADAERNRERIMQAARRLYATEGLGASMASVAREAGVGKATLSRRFATREDLIAAVFTDRMDAYATAVARARRARTNSGASQDRSQVSTAS
jgi:AcrR family transcriptional regulator